MPRLAVALQVGVGVPREPIALSESISMKPDLRRMRPARLFIALFLAAGLHGLAHAEPTSEAAAAAVGPAEPAYPAQELTPQIIYQLIADGVSSRNILYISKKFTDSGVLSGYRDLDDYTADFTCEPSRCITCRN